MSMLEKLVTDRDARIAELEAEIKRLNEAGKVLARVISDISMDDPDNDQDFKRYVIKNIDNPTAAAWVREVSK